MSFSGSEGVGRGVVVAMLLLDGWRYSASLEVPSVFGWMIFSTGAASNSGKPALETQQDIDEASESASLKLFYKYCGLHD